jgi:hypothetical protein
MIATKVKLDFQIVAVKFKFQDSEKSSKRKIRQQVIIDNLYRRVCWISVGQIAKLPAFYNWDSPQSLQAD